MTPTEFTELSRKCRYFGLADDDMTKAVHHIACAHGNLLSAEADARQVDAAQQLLRHASMVSDGIQASLETVGNHINDECDRQHDIKQRIVAT